MSKKRTWGSYDPWKSIARHGLLAFTVAIVPLSVTAADLWVDRNSLGGPCNDYRNRSQVTETTPWCTLEAAGATVEPGDVVHVREGEYTEINNCPGCSHNAVLEISVTGNAEAPIKFIAEPGDEVVLSGAGGATRGIQFVERNGNVPRFVEVDGFIARDFQDEGVFIREVSDITIRNVEITACRKGAIENHRSARVTIEGCRIHHNPMDGWTSAIDLYVCKDGNVVRGNYIWANTDEDYRETEGHGIIMDYCGETGGALIENNVIWDNEGWCIAVYHSDNADVRNNTCWQNSLGRDNGMGELYARGEHITIHNNILVSRGNGPALRIGKDETPVDVVSDHNIIWSPNTETVVFWPPWKQDTLERYQELNSMGWDAHSMQLDPQLIDPDLGDYSIGEFSPAVDAGINSESPLEDVTGGSRPFDGDDDGLATVDIGAFEHIVVSDEDPPNCDVDNDGFESFSCDGNDCDDLDSTINPIASEICGDGIDNNCDGADDEDCAQCDIDDDGFEALTCGGSDCNDLDLTINPVASETCGDGIDNNCNGTTDEDCAQCDIDGDGFLAQLTPCGGNDCQDTNESVFPGADEVCDNQVDDDCDGAIDDIDSDCTTNCSPRKAPCRSDAECCSSACNLKKNWCR